MNRFVALAFVLVVVSMGGFVALIRFGSETRETEVPESVVAARPAQHVVPKRRIDASLAMLERVAPPFEALATDGKSHTLGELCRTGPVVLTFVKDGCPCSEAAQPFFNQIQAAYPGAEFLGVIDAESEKARRWAKKFRVDYPILLDPACAIVRAYKVENSAYVVLVDARGRILKHWPGYSTSMLRELGATLAELTHTAEKLTNLTDAPIEPFSGCPFDL